MPNNKPTYQELEVQVKKLEEKLKAQVPFLDMSQVEGVKSKDEYRALYENAPSPYQSLNEDGSFKDINPAWLSTLGYERNEVVGKYYRDFLHPDWQAHFDNNFPAFKKRGFVNDVQFKIRHKKGYYLDISFEGHIGYYPDGSFRQTYCIFQDITMRKLAELKLISAEQNLSYTFNHSPSIICRANLNTGYFFEASPAVTRILGYSKEEFTSVPIMDLIHPEDRKRTADEMSEQLNGKDTAAFENRILCKDGSYTWMEWQASKADENGIISAIGTHIDERKKIEQKLLNSNKKTEESEEQLRQLFENMVQGFALHEMIYENNKPVDYRFVLINKSFERLTGLNALQVIGKTVKQVLPNTEQEWIDNYGTVAKTGIPIHFEQYAKEFDKYYDVSSYSPKKDFFAVIITDSTSQHEYEQKLKQSDRVFNLAIDMFCIAGFDGYFKYLNPAWERTLGWPAKTLLSKPWLEFVHPDDKVNTENVKSVIINGKEIYQFQNRYICKDGTIKWLSWNSQPFQNENIMVGAVRDITESKKIEKELIEAKEKAEESGRLKSAFLANMSHEIRTPMNGILGFADLLKEPGLSGETQQEYIQIIEKAGLRMLNILNDIISISKIESGLIEVDISESNINEQIEYIYTFFNKEAQAKGIQLSYSNALPLDEAILKTDCEKVYAILTNLVKNAIKYSIKGAIEFGYNLKKDNEHAELEFYVTDTGLGIPYDRQGAIFERFVQADIADKMALQGAGLGLSISKAYVEMLGGKIWVKSKIGVGSTFYFTLPYQFRPQDKLMAEKSDPNERE